jgi:hypothetical protein
MRQDASLGLGAFEPQQIFGSAGAAVCDSGLMCVEQLAQDREGEYAADDQRDALERHEQPRWHERRQHAEQGSERGTVARERILSDSAVAPIDSP